VDLRGAVKMVFFETAEKITELRKNLESKIHTRFLRTHLNHIEVLPHNASKARGIEKVLETEAFGMESVITVGDNENDLEMIKEAGMGISTGDEFPLLQKESSYHFVNLPGAGIMKLVALLERLQ
jgi:hydroxymethylpyrimidine pyrophosphatase-like HAD family hydrolase